MPTRRHSTRRVFRKALDRDARRSADVITATEIAPVGDFRLVEPSSECPGQQILTRSATPSNSVRPGSQVSLLRAFGGSRSTVIESAPSGRAGSFLNISLDEEAAIPIAEPVIDSIALQATAASGGSITFDVARYHGSVYAETLLTGVVIDGFDSTLALTDVARRNLLNCSPLVGLSGFGVPDGSLLMFANDTSVDPDVSKVHVVNILTGAVASKLFVPTAILGNSDRIAQAWSVVANQIYVLFAGTGTVLEGEDFNPTVFLQLARFVPALTHQEILNSQSFLGAEDNLEGIFFITNMMQSANSNLTQWGLMEYAGTWVSDHVSGGANPGPGGAVGNLPKSFGPASDGRYYTVADQGVEEGGGFVVVSSLAGPDDAAANGWTGLLGEGVLIQEWNGATDHSVWNLDRNGTHIYGFPAAASGPAPNLMRIAITAADWAEADSISLETSDFRPDCVIPDCRDPMEM